MSTLRLRYVHAFVDRHGRARHYFRWRGQRWPLPAPGEPGFLAAYEACKTRIASPPPPSVRFLPGSLGWAIEQFLASPEYARRAAATKATDRRIFDELRRHAGAGLLKDLRSRHVKAIRDHFRQRFTAAIADAALARLSVIWTFADEHLQLEDIAENPTAGVRRVHKVTGERKPWPSDIIEAFEREAHPALQLAFLLLLYTGQRLSDVVKMKWAQYDGDCIHLRQQKTDEVLAVPCHRRLREALDVLPRKSAFILLGERGQPLSPNGLYRGICRTLARVGIKGYGPHGLRKNAAIALAEAGCDMRLIMSVTGHRTFAMALHYSRRADQRRAADPRSTSGRPRTMQGLPLAPKSIGKQRKAK